MGTETFPFSITFTNGFYTLAQPANNNLVLEKPMTEARIETHPSNVNLFFFDTSSYNFTLCTNIVVGTRALFLAAVIALAQSSGGIPVNVTNVIPVAPQSLDVGPHFGVRDSTGLLTPTIFMAIRVNGTPSQFILLKSIISSSTATGNVLIDMFKNPTSIIPAPVYSAVHASSITQSANIAASTVTGGQPSWKGSYRTDRIYNFARDDFQLNQNDVIVLGINAGLLSTTVLSVNWIEKQT